MSSTNQGIGACHARYAFCQLILSFLISLQGPPVEQNVGGEAASSSNVQDEPTNIQDEQPTIHDKQSTNLDARGDQSELQGSEDDTDAEEDPKPGES